MFEKGFHLPPVNARRTALATVVTIGVLLTFWLLFRLRLTILLFFIAIFLSTAIKPTVSWLRARGLSRAAGIALVYAGVLGIVVTFVLLIAPMLAEQSARIADAVPSAYQQVRLEMMNRPNLFILRLGSELPEELPLASRTQRDEEEMAAMLSQTWEYVLLSGRVFFGIVLTAIMAFYWSLDGERIKRGFLLLLPQGRREGVREIIEEMEEKLARYTSGLLLLIAAVGALSFIAYLIIGLPYALLLALIAGLLEAVPVIGPALGAIPAMLIALSVSPLHALWVLLATLVIQQIENNLLFPRIMDRAVGVHPVVTLLAFVAFGLIFGVVGAVVAIPLAAVMQVLFNHFLLDPEVVVSPEPAGRDHLSVLRYEAQELVADVRKRAREAETDDREQMDLEDSIEGLALELEEILGAVHKEENLKA